MLVDHLLKAKRVQKSTETWDSGYIYQNKLGKTCFHNDMAYGNFKDSSRRKASDKILRIEAFNIAKTPKYNGYQRSLTWMVFRFFTKSFQVVVLKVKLYQTKN